MIKPSEMNKKKSFIQKYMINSLLITIVHRKSRFWSINLQFKMNDIKKTIDIFNIIFFRL